MTTRSPFLDNPLGDHDEAAQVGMAQAGDQESLESLVRRHSPWIAHPRSRRRLTSSPDITYFDPVSGKRSMASTR